MDIEPELQRMLTIPIGEIDQYKWFADDSTAREFGLFDILETLFHKVRSNPLLLSKAGNKFTGFIFYKEIGKSITGVKMASFYDDTRKPNHILAADLINFIKPELPRHDKIVWRASKAIVN
jgi:hypothetical protein